MVKVTLEKLSEFLEAYRGRARMRTLNRVDLLQVLDEARRDVWGNRSGGTVANCYKYPARQMRLLAVRKGKEYRVWFDWGNAHKGISSIPDGLPRQYGASNEDFGKKLVALPRTKGDGFWIPAAEVDRVLRKRRLDARKKARAGIVWSHPEWNGAVTRQDSIEAGNCEKETDRVAASIGDQRRAEVLRKWITRHTPELANYADRAIEKAVTRELRERAPVLA